MSAFALDKLFRSRAIYSTWTLTGVPAYRGDEEIDHHVIRIDGRIKNAVVHTETFKPGDQLIVIKHSNGGLGGSVAATKLECTGAPAGAIHPSVSPDTVHRFVRRKDWVGNEYPWIIEDITSLAGGQRDVIFAAPRVIANPVDLSVEPPECGPIAERCAPELCSLSWFFGGFQGHRTLEGAANEPGRIPYTAYPFGGGDNLTADLTYPSSSRCEGDSTGADRNWGVGKIPDIYPSGVAMYLEAFVDEFCLELSPGVRKDPTASGWTFEQEYLDGNAPPNHLPLTPFQFSPIVGPFVYIRGGIRVRTTHQFADSENRIEYELVANPTSGAVIDHYIRCNTSSYGQEHDPRVTFDWTALLTHKKLGRRCGRLEFSTNIAYSFAQGPLSLRGPCYVFHTFQCPVYVVDWCGSCERFPV